MPLWCQGKAEALTSCLFLATVGLEPAQNWSLMHFPIQECCWSKQSRICIPWDGKWAAASSWETAHSRAFYLIVNVGFIDLSCYPSCNEKLAFEEHHSSHPKAAIQTRLSEMPSELGNRNNIQPRGKRQERGSGSTVLPIRAEMSWEAASLICSLAIPEQLCSLEAQYLFAAKPAQSISS